jgi:F-type H+-transporting ATPase subunit a
MHMLAFNLIERIVDAPWPGWQVTVFGARVTLMSGGIAAMLLAAAILAAVVVPLARRTQTVPRGAVNMLEVLVVFVRDMIARPALHEKAYEFLPLLLTLFLFVLAVNLVGILPLEPLSELAGLPRVGGVATAIPTVAAGLASLSLLTIVGMGLRAQARRCRQEHGWPWPVCLLLAPLMWFRSLAPPVPGIAGRILTVPLMALEFVGLVAKCFALMVRLFANMVSGHTLLAVLMMFIVMAMQQRLISVFYIGPFCIAASVVVEVLELLVAGLQAYIFTFLTAMFLGIYAEPSH